MILPVTERTNTPKLIDSGLMLTRTVTEPKKWFQLSSELEIPRAFLLKQAT